MQLLNYTISQLLNLLSLPMVRVLAAPGTKLAELQPVRGGLLVLGRRIIAFLADVALQGHDVTRHDELPTLCNWVILELSNCAALCSHATPALIPQFPNSLNFSILQFPNSPVRQLPITE
jgi:hypothetical protein